MVNPLKLAKKGVEAGRDALAGIRAYHGSPHSFDQFDISKIGTGEGAQAYGRGLYFAENEGIARGYRDRLVSDQTNSPIAIANGYESDPDAKRIMAEVKRLALPADSLDALIKETGERAQRLAGAGYQKDAKTLGDLQYDLIEHADKFAPAGSMYEVNIAADPDAFIDWDAQISQDNPLVQRVLQEKGWTPEMLAQAQAEANNVYENALKAGNSTAVAIDYMKRPEVRFGEFYERAGKPKEWTGRDPRPTGQDLARALGEEELKNLGIPGIKYLDAGSRSAGNGSRNYVVFDDRLISIIRKYGIAGALGAGLISQEQAEAAQAQGLGVVDGKGDRLGQPPDKNEVMRQRLAEAKQRSQRADQLHTGATGPAPQRDDALSLGGAIKAPLSGLRSSAEGLLGMGGDMSFDTGLGFRLPLSANVLPTSENVAAFTDRYTPEPIQSATRYQGKNPIEQAWKWLAEYGSF